VRVLQERTLEGRLFQIAGAAKRKPRAPNEILRRVTDRKLAEADLRVLHNTYHSMLNGIAFVDVGTSAEPTWAAAAVASSSVMQDERHTDRNPMIRQVIEL